MCKSATHDRWCPNNHCRFYGKRNLGNINRHGFYKGQFGRRRRFRCKACGKTFGSTFGTPYYRLQRRKSTFDQVVLMSINGVDMSAISRITNLSWNTIWRWLDKAAWQARWFNEYKLADYPLKELQADELRTFLDGKRRVAWVMAAQEIWSRLWVSVVVGKRSLKNLRRLLQRPAERGHWEAPILITTDGFAYYEPAIGRAFGWGCIYGQVVKSWKENRVTKVEQKQIIGSPSQFRRALFESEDSDKLNTSFIERHNLTIRRSTAYLNRKTPSHARYGPRLEGQMRLLMCYFNFVRPHGALKFGVACRTPAEQAGISARRLTIREIMEAQVGIGFVAVVLAPNRAGILVIFRLECNSATVAGGSTRQI